MITDHISFIENVANRKLDESSEITDPEKVSTYDTVVFEGPPKTEQKVESLTFPVPIMMSIY